MPFRDPIVAGAKLIRDAIESEQFVAGVQGWRIARDGTAEFASLTARGEVVVGTATYYMRLYNFDDGGGLIRPSAYWFYDDGVNDPSDGYIWYDQTGVSVRGRMRLHVGPSDVSAEDIDLFMVSGNSASGGYARFTRELRAYDPITPGLADSWGGLLTIAQLVNAGTQIAQYRLCPNKDVQFRGRQSNTGANIAVGTQITSTALPVEYRPSPGYSSVLPVAGTNGVIYAIEVAATGHLINRTLIGAGVSIDFTGIRYSTTVF